jgi:hypothetical protein
MSVPASRPAKPSARLTASVLAAAAGVLVLVAAALIFSGVFAVAAVRPTPNFSVEIVGASALVVTVDEGAAVQPIYYTRNGDRWFLVDPLPVEGRFIGGAAGVAFHTGDALVLLDPATGVRREFAFAGIESARAVGAAFRIEAKGRSGYYSADRAGLADYIASPLDNAVAAGDRPDWVFAFDPTRRTLSLRGRGAEILIRPSRGSLLHRYYAPGQPTEFGYALGEWAFARWGAKTPLKLMGLELPAETACRLPEGWETVGFAFTPGAAGTAGSAYAYAVKAGADVVGVFRLAPDEAGAYAVETVAELDLAGPGYRVDAAERRIERAVPPAP